MSYDSTKINMILSIVLEVAYTGCLLNIVFKHPVFYCEYRASLYMSLTLTC